MNINDLLLKRIVNCEKIRNELMYSHGWISKENINAEWVASLERNDPLKERVSAFCARFGRMQDYFSDKLIVVWVEVVGENPGTALENFSVAEKAGILTIKSEELPGLRKLRNDLTHDYIDDYDFLSERLRLAIKASVNYSDMLDNLEKYCQDTLGMTIPNDTMAHGQTRMR